MFLYSYIYFFIATSYKGLKSFVIVAAILIVFILFILYYFPGLIVVHDLANRKSFLNLQKWVTEVLNAGRQELTGK